MSDVSQVEIFNDQSSKQEHVREHARKVLAVLNTFANTGTWSRTFQERAGKNYCEKIKNNCLFIVESKYLLTTTNHNSIILAIDGRWLQE
jgi:hypothetical protein